MKKVSIIIPCYNNELYIGPCLDSVIGQTYTNLEIIVVDDGSTDNSWEICVKYQEKDDRIKCFWQENARVGAARNKGLENITGQYVMFVDSDDILDQKAVACAVKLLEDRGADLVQWDTCFFKSNDANPNEVGSKRQAEYAEIVTDGPGAVEILLDTKGKGNDPRFVLLRNSCRCIWNKLIKVEIFQDIRFPVAFEYEDDFIVSDVFMASTKIVFFNEQFTYKRDHNNSVLHLMPLKGRFDKLECEYKRVRLVETWDNPSIMRLACHAFFVSAMNLGMACEQNREKKALKKLTLRTKREYKEYKSYLDKTDRIAVFLFLYLQRLFIQVYGKYRKRH